MRGKPKKSPREKDLTSRYLSGGLDEDRVEAGEQFKPRNKTLQQDKILRTAQLRADEESGIDLTTLPIGEVVQVHSLFSDVIHAGISYQCVLRKTMMKLSDTQVVVGDRVRFQDVTRRDDAGKQSGDQKAPPDGIIEQILPRETVLTRSDSFKAIVQHPIVANAKQMLIVASLRYPNVKWGLVDRMIVAARSGGLSPIICLNKMDLVEAADEAGNPPKDLVEADAVLAHYGTMDIPTIRTSVSAGLGLDALRAALKDQVTVLAGHSGVGKSSLIRAIQPSIDLRIGAISGFHDKGRHTTTSARRYPLDVGGAVVDTPGVKLFGLWGVTTENLIDHFPDIAAGTAPPWRQASYERIMQSLVADSHR